MTVATSGIDLGNFKTSIAFQHKGLESRAFFVSVFATNQDRENASLLKTRVDGRKRLAELHAKLERTPSDQGLQKSIASYTNALRFPHWFVPSISAFTDEFVEGQHLHYGESVWHYLSRLGAVKAHASIQRLKAPQGGTDILGLSYRYFDVEKDRIIPEEADIFGDDYRLTLTVMRHLRERFAAIAQLTDTDKQYAVIGVPPGAPPIVKAVLFMLGLEAGYDAVLVRAEPELVARSLMLPAEKPCLVIDIGAGTTDICCFIPVSGSTILDPKLQQTIHKASFAVDRRLEEMLRKEIEAKHPRGAKFYWPPLPQEHISYWKESCTNAKWDTLRSTKEHHETFVYQYKVDDVLHYYDVSQLLTPAFVAKAVDEVLTADIKSGVRVVLDPQGKQPDTEKLLAINGGPAAQRTVLAGGGSQVPQIQEIIKNALGPNHRVRSVPDHLNAVADGARFFARTVWDDDWKEIAAEQRTWVAKHRIEKAQHIEEWYREWRNKMQSSELREKLRYNMNF
ncbi:MAG: hypothetical protein ACAI25_09940 [Planctomycetota bacterium]